MPRKKSFVDLSDLGATSKPAIDLNSVANGNQFLNEADMQRPTKEKKKVGRKPKKDEDKATEKREVYVTKSQDQQIRDYCDDNFIDFSRLIKSLLAKENII